MKCSAFSFTVARGMRIRTRSRSSLTEETAHDLLADFNGDYSGRRFSPLTQINSSNVHQLSLAWASRLLSTNAARRGRDQGVPLLVKASCIFLA